ncbi:MAG: AAA family ATPase, partial [Chloroflexi bacterium]|nr:AAA family ATPase [Chloroflexota bacterium]
MRLATAYVRFYRAFNYDFLRKAHSNFSPDPWDAFEDGTDYPYIKIPIDSKLTCIVGANESGKSQLLDIIECALGETQPDSSDFCRYSGFLSASGDLRLPDTGLHFEALTEVESSGLQDLLGRQGQPIESFRLFRVHPSRIEIFAENGTDPVVFSDDSEEAKKLTGLLPSVVRIEATRALPDSVPLDYLRSTNDDDSSGTRLGRAAQLQLLDSF